jgi:hypothetical protein
VDALYDGTEWFVYSETITYFQKGRGDVVCASPTAGTDPRFKKCMFPKNAGAAIKGPRDEVDVTVATTASLLLIEAKATLSNCLSRLNIAMESDWDKLSRLLSIGEEHFLSRFSLAYGCDVTGLTRLPALAFHALDAELPHGALGIHVVGKGEVALHGLVPAELAV